MDILSNFVENLKDLMLDTNLTVKDLCKNVDIGLSDCYRCLRKENLPALGTIIKISDYFCCSIDYILGIAPYLSEDKLNYTPPFEVAFAQILKEYKISRYQLNKHTKISNSRIDDWYNGKHLPNLDNVIKLAQYFDCTIDRLLGREYR